MHTTTAFSEGLTDLQARDRILLLLLPAEAESSNMLVALSRFRLLDAPAKWNAAAEPPKSLIPETFDSILALPEVRKVACTVHHTNFSKMTKDADKSSLIFHTPGADLTAAKNITKNSLGIHRYEKQGDLSHAQWAAIGTGVAKLLEHLPGDPFKPRTAPVKLRRVISMVAKLQYPAANPPDFHIGRPTTHGSGSALSYQMLVPAMLIRGGVEIEQSYCVTCVPGLVNLKLPIVPSLLPGTKFKTPTEKGGAREYSTTPKCQARTTTMVQ